MSDHPPEAEEEDLGDGFTIGDVWSILKMQRWVIFWFVLAALAIAVVVSASSTKQYTSTATVHISTIAAQEMEMGKSIDNPNLLWNRDTYVNTQIALLRTSLFRARILQRYEELGLNDGIGANAKGFSLIGGMTVKPKQGTELLDISYTTPDPDVSARFANLTAGVLRDDALERITESALGGRSWIASRLEEMESRITSSSREILAYQQANDMVEVEIGRSALGAQVSSLKGALGQVNTQRVQQETLVREQEALYRRGEFEVLAKQMGTPLTMALISEYARAVASHARIGAVFLEGMPEYQESQREIDRIEAEFRAEVQRQLDSERATLALLRAREADLLAAIDGGMEETLGVMSLREGYEMKRLELDSAKKNYERMMERMTELELQSKTQLNNVRIVEDAKPSGSHSSPNVGMNLLIGLVGGLALGIAAAFAREFMDDSVSSPMDVQTYLRVPLLTMVPKIKESVDESQRTLYTHTHPKSNLAEAIRAMRTLIDLNPVGQTPRRLLVTSSLSSEGKTSTAMRLAIAYANLGRKVVLIDADLRRPRVHKVFGHDRSQGIVTVVSGECSLDEAIRPTGVPNLSYVAAGPSTDRPNEVIGGTQLPGLLNELDQRFDLVVIDSPPSVILSDARLLSRFVDGVIVLVKQQTTSRKLAREAVRGLQQVGARVLGVVLNEVDFRKGGYEYGYYYGYGYRYDGSYHDDEAETAAK